MCDSCKELLRGPRFEVTNVGYREARDWLIETDQLELIQNELSTDGFSLVHLANHLWDHQHEYQS